MNEQRITPYLWYEKEAEEAANFYVSVFGEGKVKEVMRYDAEGAKASGMPEGMVMTVEFELRGMTFVALNGGPEFKFTPAVSFLIDCKDQAEIDHFWNMLSEGGSTEPCGWLMDKYGLSWQVFPNTFFSDILQRKPDKAQAVLAAMFKMSKIVIADLERAAE